MEHLLLRVRAIVEHIRLESGYSEPFCQKSPGL
jgi:hypothetical protein